MSERILRILKSKSDPNQTAIHVPDGTCFQEGQKVVVDSTLYVGVYTITKVWLTDTHYDAIRINTPFKGNCSGVVAPASEGGSQPPLVNTTQGGNPKPQPKPSGSTNRPVNANTGREGAPETKSNAWLWIVLLIVGGFVVYKIAQKKK